MHVSSFPDRFPHYACGIVSPLRLRWVKGVCVFRCNLLPAFFWQNDRGLLNATAVTRGLNGHRIRVSNKVYSGEKNSPAAPAGIRTRNLWITSPAFFQQAILAPHNWRFIKTSDVQWYYCTWEWSCLQLLGFFFWHQITQKNDHKSILIHSNRPCLGLPRVHLFALYFVEPPADSFTFCIVYWTVKQTSTCHLMTCVLHELGPLCLTGD